MQSIRKKLRVRPENLTQIQDLAGCRVIVPSIGDVRKVIQFNKDNSAHEFFKDYDYISKPKKDGYRSFHRVFKFSPANDDEGHFQNRRVEIQFRTRLQHSWSTAVEAVGLYRGEDFKGGAGDGDWRRLFELMASEFATAENCPELEDAPSHKERVEELKDLDNKTNATVILENLSQAFNYTEMHIYEKAKYFLIEYDAELGEVYVKPYSNSLGGTESFDNIEAEIRRGKSLNAVLVEADKIEALKAAYPNYFGDVHVFKANLKRIVKGKDAKEYKLPPEKVFPPPPKEVADTAWFRRHGLGSRRALRFALRPVARHRQGGRQALRKGL